MVHTSQQYQSTEWEFENNRVCSECPEMGTEQTIKVERQAELKIKALVREFKHLEWMVGLIGKQEDDNYIIEDLFIPEQEVSGASVELTNNGNKEFSKIKGLIGWMHSHNSMGAFHSCTDEDTAKMLNVSITVNNGMSFDAKIRKPLTCGRMALVEAEVELQEELEVKEEIMESIKEKIKEKKYETAQAGYKNIDCGNCLGLLGKKKSKFCGACNDWVHKKCYNKNEGLCDRCEMQKSEQEDLVNWQYEARYN